MGGTALAAAEDARARYERDQAAATNAGGTTGGSTGRAFAASLAHAARMVEPKTLNQARWKGPYGIRTRVRRGLGTGAASPETR